LLMSRCSCACAGWPRGVAPVPTRRSSDLGECVPGDLVSVAGEGAAAHLSPAQPQPLSSAIPIHAVHAGGAERRPVDGVYGDGTADRKSTRLNSSHVKISYAVFCLKKKKTP